LRRRYVPASIRETAFNCPHCGAFTSQTWHNGYALPLGDGTTPFIPNMEYFDAIITDETLDPKIKDYHLNYINKINLGLIFFEKQKIVTKTYKLSILI